MKKKIVIATRKSELAMWQARHAESLLRETHPGLEVELLPMVTRGDTALPWTEPDCLMTTSSTPYRLPAASPSTTTRLP